MRTKIKNIIIIFFCLYSAFFFLGATLAPILAHFEQYDISAIFTSLYVYSCHQQPDRTFWILGYPAALCCRCLGFYIGVFIFGFIEVINRLNINKKVCIILILITIVDLVINYGFGIRYYNTGNITRFIVGLIMGLLFILFVKGLFNIGLRNEKYEN